MLGHLQKFKIWKLLGGVKGYAVNVVFALLESCSYLQYVVKRKSFDFIRCCSAVVFVLGIRSSW